MLASFNLVEKDWLPVLDAQGNLRYVNLATLFADAENIREIAVSTPLYRFSVLRFLSIVVVWLEPDIASHSQWGTLGQQIATSLLSRRNCFELFGNGPRFMQNRCNEKTEEKAIGYLFHEIPTGTNIAHFMHTRDGNYGVCPPCCVLGLLALPAFSLAGGKRYKPSHSPTSTFTFPADLQLSSRLLKAAQRIISNSQGASMGLPTWDHASPSPPGLLTDMTTYPRYVWLASNDSKEDRCLLCGRRQELVFKTEWAKCEFEINYRDPFLASDGGMLPPPLQSDESKRLQVALALPSETDSEWRVCFSIDKEQQKRKKFFPKSLNIEEWRAGLPGFAKDERELCPALPDAKKALEKFTGVVGEKATRSGFSESALVERFAKRYAPVPRLRWAELRYTESGKLAFVETMKKAERLFAVPCYSQAMVWPGIFSQRLCQCLLEPAYLRQAEKSQSPPPKEMDLYVERIVSAPGLKGGHLARLRALAMKKLSADVSAYDLFTGLYWPIRGRSPRAPRRNDAWILAKLYAKFPWVPSADNVHTLPEHLSRLCLTLPTASLARRFDRLFVMRGKDIELALQQLLALTRKPLQASAVTHPLLPGKFPPLNWSRLLHEMRDWDTVRFSWVNKITSQYEQK